MTYYSGGEPRITEIKLTGNSDGTCSPTMVYLKVGQTVRFSLSGASVMFRFEAKDLNINLMSMPNMPASQSVNQSISQLVTPTKSGNFPFSCGTNAQTVGMIMVK